MSLRSSVYSWNAASMADVCVSVRQRLREWRGRGQDAAARGWPLSPASLPLDPENPNLGHGQYALASTIIKFLSCFSLTSPMPARRRPVTESCC
jgi:hypothetical protein